MNPITNAKNLQKINERELELGLTGTSISWHAEYKDSAWIFVGGLPYELSEGDVVCIFSQYGEIVNVNLVRDKDTGKSKGFGFICYEDQRSTILCVDNLNTTKILGRIVRVDHVKDYKPPKDFGTEDQITQKLRSEGCAPKLPSSSEDEDNYNIPTKKVKKEKKKKKKKEKKLKVKKEKKSKSASEESNSESVDSRNDEGHVAVKTERMDSGYDKYSHTKDHRDGHSTNYSRATHSSMRHERQSDNKSGQYSNSARHHCKEEPDESSYHRSQKEYDSGNKNYDRNRDTRYHREGRDKEHHPNRDRGEREDSERRDKYSEREPGSSRYKDNRSGHSHSPPSRDRHRDHVRSRSRERYKR